MQEKVTKLQSELENVAFKLKNQSEEKSLTSCSCGNPRYNDKPQIISTGINTSLDLIQNNNNLNNSAMNSIKS